MNNTQRIMTITAKSLFKYFPKKNSEEGGRFCFDARKKTLYPLVVKSEVEMEDCPLFFQFVEILKAERKEQSLENDEQITLYKQFLVMDFEDVFLPIKDDASEAILKQKEELLKNAKDIIEKGFDIRFEDCTIYMMPFDKSGNMSRNGRISFINDKYSEQLNERLNIGMDFSKIKVKLSKYYAYRGLYLSTSQRVNHNNFKLTPETIIIVNDTKEASGKSFERNVTVETAKQGANPANWEFQEPVEYEIMHTETPFDGQGFIVPKYSEYINEALGVKGANSFQIRLPFAKGMLHQVDVVSFIEEFTVKGIGDKQYICVDAFGVERDLRKAGIILTTSMFKGKKWLETYCDEKEIEDPMQYYCDMIAKYNHGLYVSGTNLPYGHSKYTHLSYQVINTLAFNDEQFKRIIDGHGKFIQNPIEFLKGWDEVENEDFIKDEVSTYKETAWKKALLQNPSLADDKYIREQLDNTRKGLLSKLALGKVLVEGQTRYLCRDLLPLLGSLLRDERDVKAGYIRKLYTRFYLPRGKNSKIKLTFEDYYAFFRNPHLSRNEQYIMRAFVLPKSEDSYAKDGAKEYDKYVKYVKMYDKYFGHLTGIVMVPSGSTLPLCLGGADFDGDLVSVITNQDVVAAVQKGVYEWQDSDSLYWYKRNLPAIEIPSTGADDVYVPDYVEYEHIYNTFSNHIGQISNAAISIGQTEYDRNKKQTMPFNPYAPTCSKCTLLTGLEIDAAKNGVHPNLDFILQTGIGKSAYISFLNKFKELKSEKYFHMDKLRVKRQKKKMKKGEKDIIVLSAPSCETIVEWYPKKELSGTYINLLPKYFMEYFEGYKKLKKEKAEVQLNKVKGKSSKKDEETLKEFLAKCDEILEIYSYYNNDLLKALTREKHKGYYAVENAETLLMRTFDKDNVDKILFEVLPRIKERIEVVTKSDEAVIGDIRERINTLQWQFQPYERRGEVLEKIIGNGFGESDLTDDERMLIYHFNQQGYKLLWLLLDMIEGPKITAYDEIKTKTAEDKTFSISKEFIALEESLNEATRRYYENNSANIALTLYDLCLKSLQNTVESYSDSLENNDKLIYEFYLNTASSVGKAKFFWDIFSWNEIKGLMGVKR